MSVRRVEDDAWFDGGPGRGARLAVDDADARAVRRLVLDRKFVAQHPRRPHRQREVEHDDVVSSQSAVVEHDGAAEVDACVFSIRRVDSGFSLIDAPL